MKVSECLSAHGQSHSISADNHVISGLNPEFTHLISKSGNLPSDDAFRDIQFIRSQGCQSSAKTEWRRLLLVDLPQRSNERERH